MLYSDPKAWVSGEPGLNNEASAYLGDLDVMAVGADTWGLEAVPPPKGDKVFYGHVELLKKTRHLHSGDDEQGPSRQGRRARVHVRFGPGTGEGHGADDYQSGCHVVVTRHAG